jgi:hypothetical protein
MQGNGPSDGRCGQSTNPKKFAKNRHKNGARGSEHASISKRSSKKQSLAKRSPASPASEARPFRNLRKSKFSKRKSTPRRPDAQEPERHFYWIADGQTNIGFVDRVDHIYKALGSDERELGTFDTFKAAADAVSAASACEAAQ